MKADTNLADIQEGMQVFDSQGQLLGHVSWVYPGHEQGKYSMANVGGATPTASPEGAYTHTGGTISGTVQHEPIFQVEEGGVGQRDAINLYVPMSAVENVNAGNRVTLTVTRQEANQRFRARPDWLSGAGR